MSTAQKVPQDAKKEEFRKYLEKAGVLELLTKSLVQLYEEPQKPDDALGYLKKSVGGNEDKVTIENLKRENEELKKKIGELEAERTALKEKVSSLEAEPTNSMAAAAGAAPVVPVAATPTPAADKPSESSEPSKLPEEQKIVEESKETEAEPMDTTAAEPTPAAEPDQPSEPAAATDSSDTSTAEAPTLESEPAKTE